MKVKQSLLWAIMAAMLVQMAFVPSVVAEDEVEEDEPVVEEEVVPEVDALPSTVSPNADTFLLFTKPAQDLSAVELPAGAVVEFLVGFTNKGEEDFVIETLDASFRYPMDFTFHIQNFSAIAYQKTVKPGQESTIAYSFSPADAFAGRPIGLTINLAYRDMAGNFFFDPVFNSTVQIVEYDEGFDTEVFFMYVSMVAMGVLGLFLAYMLMGGKSKGSKRGGATAKPVATGTAGDDVDYEWIPRSALRTPGSGKTSPRQRKTKGAASSDEE